ncbi:MAG TPA: hypothetical protein VEJ00_02180, partial [Candidatus Acidoferrales bacterium]|nr:hypothetical protein [Candidatus Acidoferrales bacterium]
MSRRQTKGRENTAHGKNSFGLLLAPVVFALLAVAVLAAPPLAGAQAVTVTVSPGAAQVVTGSSLQLTSTVNGVAPGTQNQLVTWSLSGPGCSGLSCGLINAAGQYTAPASAPNPPTVFATATSIFNPGASGSATLTIAAPVPVTVTVTPSTFSIKPGAQQQFSATVTGTSSNQVVWGASGAGCFGIQCGTIDFNGVYTAPTQVPNPAVVSVTATLLSDQSKSGSAKVTIGSGIAVSVTPPTPQILLGQQQQFAATVTGSNNTAVNWTVSGAGCAGATCGNITAGGLYTAPAAMPGAPTVTITATSAADVNTNGSATLTLFATPSVSVQPHSVHVNPGAKQVFT